jgi:subtilisin family serine protease
MKYLVQGDPTHLAEIAVSLTKIGIIPAPLDFNFLKVDIQTDQVAEIQALPYVINVKPEEMRAIRISMPVDEKFSRFINLFLSNPITGPARAIAFARSATDSSRERIPTGVSRQMVGADIAEADGITGKGVKIAVLDTGTSPDLLFQGAFPHGKSAVPGQPLMLDEVGHGCFTGEAFLFTEFCGLATLEEIWNKVEAVPIPYKDGEAKYFSTKSVGYENESLAPVDTNAIFKTCASEGIRIKTLLGELPLATPWQEFYVAHPQKRGNHNRLGKIDGHARWYNGYDLELRRADELCVGDFIFAPTFQQFPLEANDNWIFPYIVGDVLGDANIRPYDDKRHSGELTIHEYNPALIAGISDRLNRLGYKAHNKKGKGPISVYSVDLKRRLKSLQIPSGGSRGAGGTRKLGRSYIFRLPTKLLKVPDAVRAFTAGFYDAEGNPSEKGGAPWFRLASVNRPFLDELRKLLLCFGIYGYIAKAGVSKGSVGYHLCFTSNNARDFAEFIRPYALKPIPEIPYKPPYHPHGHGYISLPNGKALRIERIEKTPTEKLAFYSLSIPKGHIYVASGVYSKNTWCNTCIGGRPFKVLAGPARGALLKGGALGAEVRPFKVLGGGIGIGMSSWILRGLMDALAWGADIISMSLGGPEPDDYLSDPECQSITALTKLGKICCIAAGNSGPDQMTVGGPGNCPEALTVGAVDIHGNIASFSSRGPTKAGLIKPDVVAPGLDILSTSAGYIAAMQLGDGPPQLAAISGTSMATPHAAYVSALALEYARKKGKTLTTDHIKAAMSMYGDFAEAKSNNYGWGIITYQILRTYIDENL